MSIPSRSSPRLRPRHGAAPPGRPRAADRYPAVGRVPPATASGRVDGISGWTPGPLAGTGDLWAVTGSALLSAEIDRVASAAGRRLTVTADAGEPALVEAAVVLLGSDVALRGDRSRSDGHGVDAGVDAGVGASLPLGAAVPAWRAPTVIVGLSGEGTALWEAAMRWGAERVAILPEAAAWLVDALDDGPSSAEPSERGRLIGVVGACGGAGATTVAVAVAHAATQAGLGGLLLDADPLGPGLDHLLNGGSEPGVRWPDVSEATGRIPGDQLRDAVPTLQGLPVLTGPAPPPDARIMPTLAAAAREAFPVTVVDVGRDGRAERGWVRLVDTLVLVLPARETAIVAARRVLGSVPADRVLAVVTGAVGDGTDIEGLAAAAGAGHVLPWRSLPAAGRRLHAGRPISDLVARRCRVPRAVLSFAAPKAGP